VKEALFSSLGSRFGSFNGLAVLDLFAGSGALGIEALSRGAAAVTFVDNHPDSLQLIRKNLDLTGFTRSAEVMRMDALSAVTTLDKSEKRYDIIFADPPYAEAELAVQLLQLFAAGALLTTVGVIVLETDSKVDLPLPENLNLISRRAYGDTAVWLLSATV
jgi:16S rRNA (guanine(966)-N(2))-methyltransferase RsmD